MIRPQLHKNGVTAAVDQITPTNPKSNDYGPRLAIAICFDLLQDAEKNSINSAVADPEIIIREKPIPNWQTLFTTRRRQFLKNDGSGIPLDQIDVGNSMLPVLQMAISCGAVVVTSPAAPLVLVALAAGLPSATEILFKLFQPENKKQEDVPREIKIQHYKWYSFRKWMKKPCILEQDLQVVLAQIGKHNINPVPVEYEITVRAETGQIAHRYFPAVIGTGDIEVNSKFKINWT